MSRGSFVVEILDNKTLSAAAEVADQVQIISIFSGRS